MLLFILLPIIIVMISAFIKDGSFTLEHLKKCFEPEYITIFIRSIVTSLKCTAICLLIGYPVAYILSGNTFKRKNIMLFLIVAPMWMNFLLRTYAWMTILERNGVLNKLLELLHMPQTDLLFTQDAVLLGLVYTFLPFMILPIYTSLSKMDKSIIEAARDLGAGRVATFFKVVLPLSLPGVISGFTMVFMPATTTFALSRLLGGGNVRMLGDVIEYQFTTGENKGFGAAMSLILIILILLTMSITRRYEDENEGGGLF
jgi:spermidine/putrescine transport system permease protein